MCQNFDRTQWQCPSSDQCAQLQILLPLSTSSYESLQCEESGTYSYLSSPAMCSSLRAHHRCKVASQPRTPSVGRDGEGSQGILPKLLCPVKLKIRILLEMECNLMKTMNLLLFLRTASLLIRKDSFRRPRRKYLQEGKPLPATNVATSIIHHQHSQSLW
ncbi:uncharacterized protein LOC117647283 [Thrips palmi]|uniref:Uncharacterized protein LOC117647283 n=1 Tax=Thrips palmi TaxID=161013 RepID=A0A6P8YXJ8_THRPL|nr:uncharacterized protein LOC117647283 [Thrips palmi]XP_034244878.1 uncharacterized protein LOC117647283 [Thrips palmi]XP_034244879.1 uncharacterized protein LOC117647283 [Thrips palmi]